MSSPVTGYPFSVDFAASEIRLLHASTNSTIEILAVTPDVNPPQNGSAPSVFQLVINGTGWAIPVGIPIQANGPVFVKTFGTPGANSYTLYYRYV